MSVDERVLEVLSSFVKQRGRELFSKKPEEAAAAVMERIKSYGLAAKFYLRMNWGKIERAFENPDLVLESLRSYDPEAYGIIVENASWFREFFSKLYGELRDFIGK